MDFKDFDALRIRIASPETIRSWSYGEVTKPETINYRTQKPERDGLFCERIFGPVKDYECSCGKFKKIRYKGLVCDRCGVEVTTSLVRRERMGHIELAVPVAHPLFYKVPPSKIGLILGLSINDVGAILTYEAYIVLEKGDSPFKRGEIISEEDYFAYREEYEDFKADTGAVALEYLLSKLDLEKLAAELKARIKHETSRRAALLNRLRVVEGFRVSNTRPEWMILKVLPVIPPDVRPLVALEGGRYATSDLNDLYKRVIVRNNRLKHLLSIKTPDIILKNEKRMLQDAVDALFDNESRTRPIRGKGNHPLKSLCETLRGKEGRFRRNLLGKRVDYSGRSAIVVDPDLRLSECRLPQEMAIELFKPMILHKLEEKKVVGSESGAKQLYKKATGEVWEILEEVIKDHPVLLNRAPTLHRVSIEAFYPKLSEHRAIGIHPLVCPPFNADFDGDTMSVHIPLIPEAILESALLMLAPHNILSSAHGQPLMVPSQDMVAGIYYITKLPKNIKPPKKTFPDFSSVRFAYESSEIDIHTPIRFHFDGEFIETTVGRVLFNEILPEALKFTNETYNKKRLVELIHQCYRLYGSQRTTQFLDDLKELGFGFATKSGLSMGVDDLLVPKEKPSILKKSEREVKKFQDAYTQGLMTESEKYNLVINTWTLATAEVEGRLMEILSKNQNGFNPFFILIDSGARGSKTQASQIAGMRGLMAKPKRRILGEEVIETPIKSCFKEGLSVLEYFISTHGARKGLTDTALKTAEAGYLTRRLVDVAQDVVITEEDCGTILGQEVTALREGEEIMESLRDRIAGQVALEDIISPITNEVIVKAGEEISDEAAEEIESSGIEKVRVRSVLTCEAKKGLCAKCYGRNLATGRLVEIGESVGVVAAQSIGEPGTQLTLKTFHVGGIAARIAEETKAVAKFSGRVKFEDLRVVKRSDGEEVTLKSGKLILSQDSRVLNYNVPKGARIRVKDGKSVSEGHTLFEWEPYSIVILANKAGKVRFKDIAPGVTLREDIDEHSERKQRIITEDREKKRHPAIEIVGDGDNVLEIHSLPAGAYLLAYSGQTVLPGDPVAKLMRELAKSKDITGGLPKVAELFEARKAKDPAILSEIDGMVWVGEPHKGVRKVMVTASDGTKKEYDIPYRKYLLVQTGEEVKAGDKLCEGSVDPHDVLRIKGWMAVQEFLTNQIQAVYRLQGVKIHDKHISVIVRQMLRKVKIDDAGDSSFTEGEIVDKRRVAMENERLIRENLKPASFHPLLLGITAASLSTESFFSAASFQETTRVLSDAAIHAKVDRLEGLKENVIVGRLIPAGTGYREFQKIEVVSEEEKRKEAV